MNNYCIKIPEYDHTVYTQGVNHMDALDYAIKDGSLYVPVDYPTKVAIIDQNSGVSIILDIVQSYY